MPKKISQQNNAIEYMFGASTLKALWEDFEITFDIITEKLFIRYHYRRTNKTLYKNL